MSKEVEGREGRKVEGGRGQRDGRYRVGGKSWSMGKNTWREGGRKGRDVWEECRKGREENSEIRKQGRKEGRKGERGKK